MSERTLRVLVTGANGFVGSAICRALAAAGHTAIALVRPSADRGLLPAMVETVQGDFSDPAQHARILLEARANAVIHAAAVVSVGVPNLAESLRVNVEALRHFLAAARANGVERWVQISSMSAHPGNKAVYGGTKWLADRGLEECGIAWTILRPSIIYGPQRRGIFHRMVETLRKLPLVPCVGSGLEPMRPVHVDDVAGAAVAALTRPEAIGGTYMLGCAEEMNFRDFVRATVIAVKGRAPLLVPVPLPLCRIIALGGQLVLEKPPMTLDNVDGVAQAQALDIGPAVRDLGFAPRSYAVGLKECLDAGLLDTGKANA